MHLYLLELTCTMVHISTVFGCQEHSLFQQHTPAKKLTLGIFSNPQLSPSAAQTQFNTVLKSHCTGGTGSVHSLKSSHHVNVNLRKKVPGHQNVFYYFKFWRHKEEPMTNNLAN